MSSLVPNYIDRAFDDELDLICSSVPAALIEGPRGVGKTATASRRAKSLHDLDDPEQRAVAAADPAMLLEGEPPILIDEWQHIPQVWDLVRRAVDRGVAPGTFLLTGSAGPSSPPTHSGAGRIVTARMRPMSLAERFPEQPTVSLARLLTGGSERIGGETERGLSDYVDEILRSGFPGIRRLDERGVRLQLDGYLQRLTDRELLLESDEGVRNPRHLRRWMAAFAAAISTTTSFEKIKLAAEGPVDSPSDRTARNFRHLLEQLWIIEPLPAWHPTRSHLRRIGRSEKHQLADPALAARLLNVDRDALLSGKSPAQPRVPRDGPLLGALFESLVTLSVRVYAQAAEAEAVSHLRVRGGEHEVDLIVERRDGRILAIEVKLKQTIDDGDVRHLHWLAERAGDDLVDSVVVTTGRRAYRRADGIAVVPAALLGP